MCNEIDFAEFSEEVLKFMLDECKEKNIREPFMKVGTLYNIILGITYGASPVIDKINAFIISERIMNLSYPSLDKEFYSNMGQLIWTVEFDKVLGNFILNRYKELKGID